MTGITPERLAEIRANLPDPSADLSIRERNAHALLAEVDRLRKGIADMQRRYDDDPHDVLCEYVAEELYDLLKGQS